MDARERFTQWLIEKGYPEFTPAGNRSTARDYPFRVEQVCENENLSWDALAAQIDSVIPAYDRGGVKEAKGNQSNRSVINALKRYREFVKEQ